MGCPSCLATQTTLLKRTLAVGVANFANMRPVSSAVTSKPTNDSSVTRTCAKVLTGTMRP